MIRYEFTQSLHIKKFRYIIYNNYILYMYIKNLLYIYIFYGNKKNITDII